MKSEALKAAQKRYKAKLRTEGRCADCPTPTGYYRCDYHRDKVNQYKRESYKRKAALRQGRL